MTTFFVALIPIMVLIALGYLLKRNHFLSDEAWAGMERLTYYVLFPMLLIRTLGSQSLNGVPWPPILLVVVVTITASALLLIVLRRVMTLSNATFTSIFQGGVRFNTYIMLAVAQSLYGAAGLAVGSVAAGFMIVLINLWCIAAFLIWGRARFEGVIALLRQVVANPLIISCTIGWLLSSSGLGLPWLIGDILELISRAALPFGLLAVGAALKLKSVHGHIKPVFYASLVQFCFKPLLAAGLLGATGLGGAAAAVLIIAFITPTAPSGYILARQLGGDTETMASIITLQTLLAFLLMPLWVTVLL